jgi:hypothetical protein
VRPYLEKPFTKIGLVEWLKMKTLSSSPSTEKKKKTQRLFQSPQAGRDKGQYSFSLGSTVV